MSMNEIIQYAIVAVVLCAGSGMGGAQVKEQQKQLRFWLFKLLNDK